MCVDNPFNIARITNCSKTTGMSFHYQVITALITTEHSY